MARAYGPDLRERVIKAGLAGSEPPSGGEAFSGSGKHGHRVGETRQR